MREELFIDWVDFEWCCRASQKSFCILSVPGVSIEHRMGNGARKIAGRTVALRNRVRYYYMIRNGFYIIFHLKVLKPHEKFLFLLDLMVKMAGICVLEKKAGSLLFKAVRDGVFGDNMGEMKKHEGA